MDWKNLKLILFGGKGGVGKTTAASAAALYLAQTKRDNKILIISTDPAHSLADSLNYPIGEEITPVKCLDNLWAQELSATRLGADFKEKHGDVIKKLIGRGTYFDQQDMEDFFSLSLPGMDEVMAIIEVARVIKDKQFDQVILDTAPTGHTLRLLSLPKHMEKWIQVLDLMQEKHRYLARHFAGRYVKDDADKFLATMMSDIKRVKSLLSDFRSTEFVPVTIPESMGIYETERLLRTLKDHKVPVKNVIVNRVAEERECKFCASRRRDQEGSLREIDEKFGAYNLIKVPLFPHQVRGIRDLVEFAKYLFGEDPSELAYPLLEGILAPDETRINTEKRKEKSVKIRENPQLIKMSDLLEKNPQFLLFGGKGGIGKTSIAAATALRMARRNPTKKVLIFSTDPAHSLSDSFHQEIGDKITSIYYEGQQAGKNSPQMHADSIAQNADKKSAGISAEISGNQRTIPRQNPQSRETAGLSRPSHTETNLFAMEIDAAKLFDDLKNEYKESIEEMFDKLFGGGVDMKFDREVMTQFISLSPPGLDEVMALKEITDFQNKGEYDFFILDTAPTGHLLRFLEMPDLIREWLNALFGLLLKYKNVIHLGTVVDRMLELSRSMRKIRAILTDPQKTDFVAITISEAMAVLEMERLLPQLKELGIPCSHIVVNKVIPPTECSFCALKRQEQTDYIKEIQSKFPGYTTAELPLFPHEIRGIDSLTELSEAIYAVDPHVHEMKRLEAATDRATQNHKKIQRRGDWLWRMKKEYLRWSVETFHWLVKKSR